MRTWVAAFFGIAVALLLRLIIVRQTKKSAAEWESQYGPRSEALLTDHDAVTAYELSIHRTRLEWLLTLLWAASVPTTLVALWLIPDESLWNSALFLGVMAGGAILGLREVRRDRRFRNRAPKLHVALSPWMLTGNRPSGTVVNTFRAARREFWRTGRRPAWLSTSDQRFSS
jgi:hypothetical protein